MTKSSENNRRTVAIVLALVSVAALGFAAMSKRWLYNPRTVPHGDEVGFGPRGNYRCHGDHCTHRSNAELVAEYKANIEMIQKEAADDPNNTALAASAARNREEFRASAAFSPFGWITFIAISIAALSLLAAAGIVAAKKRLVLPVMPTTTALLGCMVGLITGCVFVAIKPGASGFVGVNFGFWAFGGGVIAGIASCLMLNKLMRPVDPDLLEDAMNPEDFPS